MSHLESIERNRLEADVQADQESMAEFEEKLSVDAADHDTLRRLKDCLESGGTREAEITVQEALEKGQDHIGENFERNDEHLEKVHEETGQRQTEYQERADVLDANIGNASDTSQELKNEAAVSEAVEIKSALLEDHDLFSRQIAEIEQNLERSRALREDYRGRVAQ